MFIKLFDSRENHKLDHWDTNAPTLTISFFPKYYDFIQDTFLFHLGLKKDKYKKGDLYVNRHYFGSKAIRYQRAFRYIQTTKRHPKNTQILSNASCLWFHLKTSVFLFQWRLVYDILSFNEGTFFKIQLLILTLNKIHFFLKKLVIPSILMMSSLFWPTLW